MSDTLSSSSDEDIVVAAMLLEPEKKKWIHDINKKRKVFGEFFTLFEDLIHDDKKWQWHKFKDYLHYYALVGLIPVGGIVFFSNVFIGPATLTEIPEGYVPKHWEYYRNPIQRFFARYIYPSHQQEYEKFLHLTFEEEEKMKLRKLQKEVYDKMGTRGDYQAYFYRSLTDLAKNRRMNYEYDDERRTVMGDNEVYTHSYGERVEHRFGKTTLSTPSRDSNLDLPVTASLVHCESSALHQAANGEENECEPSLELGRTNYLAIRLVEGERRCQNGSHVQTRLRGNVSICTPKQTRDIVDLTQLRQTLVAHFAQDELRDDWQTFVETHRPVSWMSLLGNVSIYPQSSLYQRASRQETGDDPIGFLQMELILLFSFHLQPPFVMSIRKREIRFNGQMVSGGTRVLDWPADDGEIKVKLLKWRLVGFLWNNEFSAYACTSQPTTCWNFIAVCVLQWLTKLEEDPQLEQCVVWTDGAKFHLSGSVNRHNCVYWRESNPSVVVEYDDKSPGVMVWGGVTYQGVIGPFFFEDGLNVHPTKIRTLISPSSAVELNMTSALANYTTEEGNDIRRMDMGQRLQTTLLRPQLSALFQE
uniref:NADH dehydrogenase [ubiquinone] 1 beta subcomplex subunit 5, mitochondrial n=1 Tax=Timema bartmani TaxID=61472 RepID=A0A7R9EPS5_9NEOP|nr:unnamed protein product [Timema bartmani]